MIALVIMAMVAVGLMLWSQQANRTAATKARAKPAALPVPAGNDVKH
jgi:type VI protein secretion system component VasK